MMELSDINWSYYWDEITDRMLYIIGFLVLISMTELNKLRVIGPIIIEGQNLGLIPSRPNLINILLYASILVIFAVSWDFLAGYSGQVSFGHALFLGMGAYLTALIKLGLIIDGNVIFPGLPSNTTEIFGIFLDLSVLNAVFLAALLVSLFAVIIGLLTLRMKGPYFALATLVLPLIAQILVTTVWSDFTGGQGGISILSSAPLVLDPVNTELEGQALRLLKREQLYFVILVITLISVMIMYFLARSRYGLVLKSIREDELAASASGVNITRYKLTSIGISGFFASFAGGLFIQVLGSASSSLFIAERSFEVIIFTILGGIGTIVGAVIGTYLLVFGVQFYIERGFIDIPTIEYLIFALILIVVLKYQSRGIINAEPQLRNAIVFSSFFTILVAFYEQGSFLSALSEKINPGTMLQNTFGDLERGLLGIDVGTIQGRMIIYFILGIIMGYWGPDLFQKIRLKVWGVWPSLGDFEPPE